MSKDQMQPSKEIRAKKPDYRVGDRVQFSRMEGAIEAVRDVGIQRPIFEYMVKYNDQELNEGRNWLISSNLQKI